MNCPAQFTFNLLTGVNVSFAQNDGVSALIFCSSPVVDFRIKKKGRKRMLTALEKCKNVELIYFIACIPP